MGKSIVWNDAKFYRYFNMSVYFTQLLMFSIFFLYWKYVMFISTDHGGSDSTVIKRRQQQLGRMADFLSSVTFSVFDL